MKQILHLPDYSIRSLNEFTDRHWAVRSRIKKADRELVQHYATEQGIIPAEGKRRISLRIVLPKGQRRLDKDNCKKVILDSLKQSKVIRDDSPKWLEEGPIEYVRHDGELREVFIILEDVP